MANSYFQFKKFKIIQDRTAMKVTTDSCLFGAWVSNQPSAKGTETVLDIGTGTGLLALMYAQKHPFAQIDAIEVDKNAAEQAAQNIQASEWSNRIRVICDDVKNHQFNSQYDRIIANPPFYENELKGNIETRNRAHHDNSLLFSQLLPLVAKNLKPEGRFYCMIPQKREMETEVLLEENGFEILQKVQVRQTISHGIFRMFYEVKPEGTENDNKILIDICVKDDNQEYTIDFKRQLSSFYLQL